MTGAHTPSVADVLENPNAFPFSAEYGHPAACGGMTLRDYFAGQAVPALVAAMAAGNYEMGGRIPAIVAAEDAYKLADAMLAARATSKEAQGNG